MVVFGRFMFQRLVVVVVANLQLKDYVNIHTVVLVISKYIGSIVKGKLMVCLETILKMVALKQNYIMTTAKNTENLKSSQKERNWFLSTSK